MEDVFPDPFSFDIERHRAERDRTDRSSSYAPFGLGTHKCLGFQWVELHLAINLLLLVHYFRFELAPTDYQLRINPFPTMSPTRKMKLRIADRRHELSPSHARSARPPADSSSSGATTCPVAGAGAA